MNITFSPEAQEDYEYWKKTNPNIVKRIKLLLEDMCKHPYIGIGKPEKLKYDLAGKWSRRITDIHRIVYFVDETEEDIFVLALRYHYSK
ncbi:MAG: Txe/YoeB family addiction module toxin [Dysgonamonadaceae bacterium]|nr:Txe/YoeB family addiction module toxin [Dysgonamonadaceae bacterium]